MGEKDSIIQKNPQKPKQIVKRGKNKNRETSLNIFSTNAASLSAKLNSLKSELKRCQSSLFTLQETHYSRKRKSSY